MVHILVGTSCIKNKLISSGYGVKRNYSRENTGLKESTRFGTTKIDLRENLSYFGSFLLNQTSERCYTQQLQTDHTHSCRHTIPCTAASLWKAVPDHTPGPPDFTNHPRKVCGKYSYLHGTRGVADPFGEGNNTLTQPTECNHVRKLHHTTP